MKKFLPVLLLLFLNQNLVASDKPADHQKNVKSAASNLMDGACGSIFKDEFFQKHKNEILGLSYTRCNTSDSAIDPSSAPSQSAAFDLAIKTNKNRLRKGNACMLLTLYQACLARNEGKAINNELAKEKEKIAQSSSSKSSSLFGKFFK